MNPLHSASAGEGPALLLIHGTGTSSSVFDAAVAGLSRSWQVITFDRPGWGLSPPPDDYRRTSIAEQSIAAAAVLRQYGSAGARVLGVGLGAVVALELALAEPELVESAILLDPPILDTLRRATEGMSADVAAITEAAEEGGEAAVLRLYLEGGLPTLGAGAGRLAATADTGPAAAHSLLVELPAVPAWPLDPMRVSESEVPVQVVTTPSSPELLVEAADALVPRIPAARRVIASDEGPQTIAALVGDPQA